MNADNDMAKTEQERRWGLCATCRHLVIVTSDRGSTFVQCGLAKTDPRFAKYPRLPVIECPGHDKIK